MLLMALDVCWAAAMTKRNPAQGSRPFSGRLGSRLGPSEQNETGFLGGLGVQGAGVGCPRRLRREGAEPPGG